MVGSTATSDVVVDRGGGDSRTAQHFGAPGDDSHPLPGDFVATTGQAGTGRDSAVGYIDPLNTQTAQPGDKRIYARDAATGEQVGEVWLKSDGTATIVNDNGTFTLAPTGSITGSNANGSFVLQAGGAFVVNGVTIAANGAVDIPSSLTLAGKQIAGHTHGGVAAGGSNTLGNN
jgi:hypothetical protein